MPTIDATEARVKRWCDEVRAAIDARNPYYAATLTIKPIAERLMVLSDQEAAERVEAGTAWAEWDRLRDDFERTTDDGVSSDDSFEKLGLSVGRQLVAKASLDSFVRQLVNGSCAPLNALGCSVNALAEAMGSVPEEPVAWRCRTTNGLGWAYLTEHRQGLQMGPEWEPLYATTPRPALSTQAEGGGTEE